MTETIRDLLSQGLDLCVRARKMDEMDRRSAAIEASDDNGWGADARFSRYVTRHNHLYPDQCIATRSGTVALWVQDQYEKDLADWERRARAALSETEGG